MRQTDAGREDAPTASDRAATKAGSVRRPTLRLHASKPELPFTPKHDEILVLPLGGCGAIGMNMTLYGHGGKWLIVDAGVAFADDRIHPGLNAFMPDPAFIEERMSDVVGLVVTHAHEDHIGAIHHLWPRIDCPIYATPFASSLLRGRFREAGKLDYVTIKTLEIGAETQIGPFRVGTIETTHSVPEPVSLAIKTAAGTVLHTGDWKFDDAPQIGRGPDRAAYERLGDDGVLAMVCDSTNALVDGRAGSEAEAGTGLTAAIASRRGLVAVACFSSNVARLKSIAMAAKANGRKVALSGRSLRRMEEAARENGLLKGVPQFLDEANAKRLKRNQVLLVCTGTQGEERSALSRLANGDHRTLSIEAGDTVIFSAREIPGREEDIARVQAQLRKRGAEIVTPKDEPVHVSGHAKRDELREMYALVRPTIAIPVHGTPEMMAAHGALARRCGVGRSLIPQDGLVLRLAGKRGRAIGTVDVPLFADTGAGLVPVTREELAAEAAANAAKAPAAKAPTAKAPTTKGRAAKAPAADAAAAPKPATRRRRRSGRRAVAGAAQQAA